MGVQRCEHKSQHDVTATACVSVDRLHPLPHEVDDARSHINRVHQQTTLVSQPLYSEARRKDCGDNIVFEVSIGVVHYRFGAIEATGYGSQVAMAREAAAAQLLQIIKLGEDNPLANVATLNPSPVKLSAAVIKQREIRAHHLRMMQSMTQEAGADDCAIFIDVEAWDGAKKDPTTGKKPQLILEVGVSVVPIQYLRRPDCLRFARNHHFIVKEHLSLRNSFCADNKMKFERRFGESAIINERDVVKACSAIISKVRDRSECTGRKWLVGHSIQGDKKWLEQDLGISMAGFEELDIAEAFAAHEQRDSKRKLEWICAKYGIETAFAHNAGNDTVYTLQACSALIQDLC